jgi:4-aminobutyrate aminotransferase-like enzyme/MOSC domain-containing protein YiiM
MQRVLPDPLQLLAVSLGLPEETRWRGQTIQSGIFKSPIEGRVSVGSLGIEGDGQADLSVHGGIDKAVYAYDESNTQYWRDELGRPELAAGAFGENLTLVGWPEGRVRIGDLFRIGTTIFEVSQPRQPCMKLGVRFDDPKFPKRFLSSGRVGFYLRVIEDGSIGAGDEVTRVRTNEDGMSISSLVALWLDRDARPVALERALSLESLADAWRKPLQERLERSFATAPYNALMTQSPIRSERQEPPLANPPKTLAPSLRSEIPGPESRALAARLARVESRNVTCLDPAPIFWERASFANLWDVDGNRFVDLTAAFGVANVGHAHPEVVGAISSQAEALLHGMGDVHPPRVKVELLEQLSKLYPRGVARQAPDVRCVLSSSGSDAVETAIKTALLATGRPGILAFEGAYHGLSLGALDCTWRSDFREPFRARLPGETRFAPYGDLDHLERIARDSAEEIGAVLVEPVQGRGGERVPPPGFMRGLRALCDKRGWLLIADEIYTGFGRTGAIFACDHEAVVPDLLCVGKGLASGMPISACMGLKEVFDAWPRSEGEALHTQTFLGHPASCAAAIASLAVAERWQLADRSRRLGRDVLEHLRARLTDIETVWEVRGLGLMIGIECSSADVSLAASAALLERGYVLLPSGDGGRVLSLTPPLTIDKEALFEACDEIARHLESVARSGSNRTSA